MIDLVLCTKDRPSEFAFFLKMLDRSTNKNFNLIVVDQSNDINSRLNLNNLNNYTFEHCYIKDFSVGLSKARNTGIQYCKHQIVGFPDDDCYYPPTLLQYVTNRFDNPSLQILSGTYGPERPDNHNRDVIIRLNFFNIGKHLSSVTFFARREELKDFKFDERIGAGTRLPFGEEIDFVFRNLNRKKLSQFDSKVFVYHPRVKNIHGQLKANYVYGVILGLNHNNNIIKFYFLIGLLKLVLLCTFGCARFEYLRYRILGCAHGIKMKADRIS